MIMGDEIISIVGALVSSILGGAVTGVSMLSSLRTEITWLKLTCERLERQHETVMTAITAHKLGGD